MAELREIAAQDCDAAGRGESLSRTDVLWAIAKGFATDSRALAIEAMMPLDDDPGRCRSSQEQHEIVRRTDKEAGFKVLPKRWAEPAQGSACEARGRQAEGVERTFSWMTRWKRLVRDYEQRLDVSEAMIHIALGSLMLRRIVHP